MRKRLCLIAGSAIVALALVGPSLAPAATCSSNPVYCPAKRLPVTGFSARTVPARDHSYPYTFTTTGRIGVPASVGNGAGCHGKVSVTMKVKKVTVSNRIAFAKVVDGRCTYSSQVTFAWRQRIRTLGGTPFGMDVIVRFLGNKYLQSTTHPRYTVIAG
jgi:hypothetical protein